MDMRKHLSGSALTKAMAMMILLVIVLSLTAAAADFHPRGYEKQCTLCQISHSPLTETAIIPFSPDVTDVSWTVPFVEEFYTHAEFIKSVPGRSPPSC